MGFESHVLLQQSDLGFGYCPTNSTDEMICDVSSERLPSPQSMLSHRWEQVVNNMVCDSRDEEIFGLKSLWLPSMNPMIVKRRVRFQTPLRDSDSPRLSDVDENCVGIESLGDDPHLDELYWSQNDLIICRKRAQLKASLIREKFPLEVESLEHVIQNFRVTSINGDGKRCHENDSKVILADNAASCLQFLNSETEDVLAMYNWSRSYVRGLEDYVTPILSSERHFAIHQFLSYQEFLRHRVPGTSIEAALCERSRKLSQNARLFAFKVAIGDALAATHHS